MHPRDLEQHNCLRLALPGLQNTWRFRSGSAEAFDVAVQGSLLISNVLALRRAVRAGVGLALLADWLVGEDLRNGTLLDVFPNHDCAVSEFDTAAWALYPNRRYLPQKVRVAIDYFRTQLRGATNRVAVDRSGDPGGA